ncbi:MAG: winged helix-turn-helix domain-containing protein [Roseiflexaceae bacterium]|nr:winged helix-turn-helix domain-containing protein [Roseiflexus sp.]MCS7290262.1 winged helix-turn-helix domain-containing protein [Roseiflexus sp.]MDW8146016.1 winged helix-turn-helix domain-containing protein [Roseiflexaceae bacterium]MDW8214861.1 winged helix-turn-helix domain-containing protein [Roseiflexaceae bacterium]
MNPFGNRKPVIDPECFTGRRDLIAAIYERLTAAPPQCCALVGDARSGKTSLLYYLRSSALAPSGIAGAPAARFVFPYVNAGPYADLGVSQSHGALFFWRDLTRATAQALAIRDDLPALPDQGIAETAIVDVVYALKCTVEDMIRRHGDRTFVFLIDNVEGIARLPRHTASFLRSLTQDPDIGARVAYVVTASAPLSRLYSMNELREPSSFWGLFASELFLGKLSDSEIAALLARAPVLSDADRAWIRRLGGANLMLLLIAAAHVYDWRLHQGNSVDDVERAAIEEARPLCRSWWRELTEMHTTAVDARQFLTDQQRVSSSDEAALFEALHLRGLAQRDRHGWRISSAIFAQALSDQPSAPFAETAPPLPSVAPATPPAFTHLEGEVYAFLRENAGRVCSREEVKRAIWPVSPPSDSALQKIIERIREKIEPDPKHPRKLIAVRGQGYMLRRDSD